MDKQTAGAVEEGMGRPVIYLAGPMTGCNSEQMRNWRNAIKSEHRDEFVFVDPCDNPIDRKRTHFDVAISDLTAIDGADALLAYMWKELIGTAHGVFYAKSRLKTVVVVDPNHYNNRILAYYADAVVPDLRSGIKSIRTLISNQRDPLIISKGRNCKLEQFSSAKLVESIRRACKSAGRSDVLIPVDVVPKVIELIIEEFEGRQISTSDIRDTVLHVLTVREAEPTTRESYTGIRDAWVAHEWAKEKRRTFGKSLDDGDIAASPLPLDISSGEDSSVWGPRVVGILSVPLSARKLFRAIARVAGIERIKLGRYRSAGPKDHTQIKLSLGGSTHIINGIVYDNGEKGSEQMFQVFVRNPQSRATVFASMLKVLQPSGALRD